MAINYEEELRRGQSTFGSSRTAGASAFRQAYQRLASQADLARQNIGADYASMYQQLRGQQYAQGLGAAAQRGLTGGQAAGVRQQVGAQQMAQLGGLMQNQERAAREQRVQEASIYSNALLEGQQAQEMENQRIAQIQSILTDANGNQKDVNKLTPFERERLKNLGYDIRSAEGFLPAGVVRLGGSGPNNTTVYANPAAANANKPAEREGFTLRLVEGPFGRGSYWVYVNNSTGAMSRA